MTVSRLQLLLLVSLLLACSLIYWPALHGPFLFDDYPNLAALTSIDHVSSWRDLGIYLSQPRYFPGRPVAMLSFLLQKASWPDHPFPFRLVNLGIHLFNGMLVFALVLRVGYRWLGSRASEGSVGRNAWLAASLASAAWLLNPIQLSGVALVVQRMTLLAGTFTLLGLLAYLRGLLEESLPALRRGAWMTLGLGPCMALGFLSKENGILLPLFALALDSTILRTTVERLPAPLIWLRRLLTWPVALFVVGYLLWILPREWGHYGMRDFTVGQRLLTEPRILFNYLEKIFLPSFGKYGLYHDGYTVSRNLLSPWTTLPALLGLIGALIAALVGQRRWPLFAMAVLWYVGGQLLESSTITLELYFEHRNYLPLVGPVMALALGVASTPQGQLRRLLIALSSLWLLACGFTTWLSASVYASEDRLALTWANDQPNSLRAETYLAERLFKHGQSDAALKILDKALRNYPDNAGLVENRLYVKCMQGTLAPADIDIADAQLQKSGFDRGGMEGVESLRVLANSGKCPALNPDIWLKLTDTLLANPSFHDDPTAAGFLHYQKHYWAVSRGNLAMAISELDATYRNDPDAEVPRLKAKYLVSAGLYDQAIEALRDTDYSRLPLLRRLLVDDRAINAEDIAKIEEMRKKAASGNGDKTGAQ